MAIVPYCQYLQTSVQVIYSIQLHYCHSLLKKAALLLPNIILNSRARVGICKHICL